MALSDSLPIGKLSEPFSAHSDDGNSFSVIHLRLLNHPIPASLDGDIAQQLSLAINGVL